MTRFLLDTHALLFWWSASSSLGAEAVEAISDSSSAIFVSAVSALEIATKFRIGKLPDIGDPWMTYPKLIDQHGFRRLAISEGHALRAGLLTGKHRDPFDRLIAAQALIDDMVVITRDRAIADFGCKVLW